MMNFDLIPNDYQESNLEEGSALFGNHFKLTGEIKRIISTRSGIRYIVIVHNWTTGNEYERIYDFETIKSKFACLAGLKDEGSK